MVGEDGATILGKGEECKARVLPSRFRFSLTVGTVGTVGTVSDEVVVTHVMSHHQAESPATLSVGSKVTVSLTNLERRKRAGTMLRRPQQAGGYQRDTI